MQNTIMDSILSDDTPNVIYGCNSCSFVCNSYVECLKDVKKITSHFASPALTLLLKMHHCVRYGMNSTSVTSYLIHGGMIAESFI